MEPKLWGQPSAERRVNADDREPTDAPLMGLVLVGAVACIAAMNFRTNKTLAWPSMIV